MTTEATGHASFPYRFWNVSWRATRNFFTDDCMTLAAAIAFYALLSLAPALYLLGYGLSAVFVDEDVSRRAVEIAAELIPAEAVPTVERVQQALELRGSFVLVALPGLLWIATSVLHALQNALSVTFARKPRGHQIWTQRLKSLVGLVAAGALLGGLLLLNAVPPLVARATSMLGLPPTPVGLARWVSFLIAPLVTFVVFYSFYRVLPPGRCGRWPAAIGALVALLAKQVALAVFGVMLSKSPGFGLVTGALAGVLAFLVWIYTGVLLILFGAEVAAVLNGDRPA